MSKSETNPEKHELQGDRESSQPMIDKNQLLAIERPKSLCAECGAPLEELDKNPTRLVMKDEESRRADFCPDCWEFAKDEAFDSYWVTRRIHKEKKAPKLSRREKGTATRALFESLWDKRDEEDVDAHLYFLAHLLLRWGALKWKKSYEDETGREFVIFENPTTGDPVEIAIVDTTEESIAEIRDKIEAFLREYAPDDESLME